MIGPLPAGFLRLTTEREIQESADRQAAIALYQQQNASYMVFITNCQPINILINKFELFFSLTCNISHWHLLSILAGFEYRRPP